MFEQFGLFVIVTIVTIVSVLFAWNAAFEHHVRGCFDDFATTYLHSFHSFTIFIFMDSLMPITLFSILTCTKFPFIYLTDIWINAASKRIISNDLFCIKSTYWKQYVDFNHLSLIPLFAVFCLIYETNGVHEKKTRSLKSTKKCSKESPLTNDGQFTLALMMNKQIAAPFLQTNEPFCSQQDFFLAIFLSISLSLISFCFGR